MKSLAIGSQDCPEYRTSQAYNVHTYHDILNPTASINGLPSDLAMHVTWADVHEVFKATPLEMLLSTMHYPLQEIHPVFRKECNEAQPRLY